MTQRRMELIDLKTVILSFRITDLQALLTNFGCNPIGRKNDLQNRALELLFNPPPTMIVEKYKQKIRELFREEQQSQMPHNSQKSRNAPFQQRSYGALSDQFSHSPSVVVRNHNLSYQNGGNYSYTGMYIQQPKLVECNISNAVQFEPRTSSANIKFKRLPFFNVKQEILGPTILMMNSQTTLRINGKVSNTHEFTISFVLTCDIASEIAMHRDITNKKYTVQLQLRTCAVESNIDMSSAPELDDFMPLGLVVRVNGVQCTALPPLSPSSRPNQDVRRIPGSIDLSALLRLSPKNINTLTINWLPEVTKTFHFTLNLVEKLSSNFLLDKLNERSHLTVDFTKLMIRKQYRRVIDDEDDDASATVGNVDDDDIATTIVRVSLMCPLAKFRMIYPAKGRNCSHLQCFDGFAFISMNEKKSMWICPVCHKRLSFDELFIDQYFVDVLKNADLSEDCQEVQLLVDGSWKSYFEESTNDVSNETKANLSANSPADSSASDKDLSVSENVRSTTNDVGDTEVSDVVTNDADTVVDLTCEDNENDDGHGDEVVNEGENLPASKTNDTSTATSLSPPSVTPTSTDESSHLANAQKVLEDSSESLPLGLNPSIENKDENVVSSAMEIENTNTTGAEISGDKSSLTNRSVISLDSSAPPSPLPSPLPSSSLNELKIGE